MRKYILLILIIGLFVLIGATTCLTAISLNAEPKNRLLVSQTWGNIFGKIDYQNGSLVQGATVDASHHIIDIFLHDEDWNPYYNQTNENGQYSIDLPPGDYFVAAFKLIGQRGWAAHSSIVVSSGDEKEVSMTLRTIFDNNKVISQQLSYEPTNN